MEKAYDFKALEAAIYERWEKSGYFNPDNLDLPEDAPNYTIILPPPNITDKLHLGHSSMLAIEDLMIRFRRMSGYRTLWLPGTDHAAIATQNVVEKRLHKEQGLTRHDLGREKFLELVWEFLRGTQSTILKQTRSMGASLDWSREAFTLDESRAKAVRKMFVLMHREGVIYRGERIVNWCPRCASTLADDEVEYEAQQAKLYTFRYCADFPIEIATTRPETKLGDTAVAVNPKDGRYKDFVGRSFKVDFLGVPLNIKVIGDWRIDMEFGTGALGVTPAHSAADWQMAEEQNLDILKVIDEKGDIRPGFGDFSGLSALAARAQIVEKLKTAGLLVKEEEIENNLSVCYRCGTAIEPLPSKQWFVSVDKKLERLGGQSLKEKAMAAASKEEIKFVPGRFTKKYLDWMENLHDWCISRQIWFGHRIPAWYCPDCQEVLVAEEDPEQCPKCGSKKLSQDEDSLDTWFSSGMWTFSTLGWPDNFKNGEKSGDLAKYHPTQVLETGYEIITLWVSRMVIMSFFALDEIPFETVYLHGMVLDKHGKKMSKSKGNGIDPLEMIEKFGTDAVRLSLLIGNTPGNDVRISEEKIDGFKKFVNKLWNVARYILSNTAQSPEAALGPESLTLSDKAALQETRDLIRQTSEDLASYRFSQAGERLRNFTWNFLADWYVEAAKFDDSQAKDAVLRLILKDLLKLWHPFIPFVTEAIWEQFGQPGLLLVNPWPGLETYDRILSSSGEAERARFGQLMDIVTAVRNARSENKIEPSRKLKAVIAAGRDRDFLESQKPLLLGLRTGISDLEILEKADQPDEAIAIGAGGIDIYLIGAVDKEKEKKRLLKEMENLQKALNSLNLRLGNPDFLEKAPPALVKKEQARQKELARRLAKYEEQLGAL